MSNLLSKQLLVFFFLLSVANVYSRPLSEEATNNLGDQCDKSWVEKQDQILLKQQILGKLNYFEWGDLFHGIVRTKNGGEENFIANMDDSCFLAQHKQEWLKIEYNLVCYSLPDQGGIYPLNVITQIQTRNTDLKSWVKKLAVVMKNVKSW